MSAGTKKDAYQIITDRILEALESGVVPWRQPWASSGPARSVSTGKPYRGINQFLLALSSYTSPYWVTYKQAEQRGWQVRRGEKSTAVVFWKWLKVTDKETSEPKKIPFLRYFRVFNVEQCDGECIPTVKVSHRSKSEVIGAALKIVENMPNRPTIDHGGDRAFYRPASDSVTLPEQVSFETDTDYYATAFHELAHSTGHKSRIGRAGITEQVNFGSYTYGREELIAEFSAAFLCQEAGILDRHEDQAASYIDNWRRAIKADAKLVVQAAAQAQKATDYILDRQWLPEAV